MLQTLIVSHKNPNPEGGWLFKVGLVVEATSESRICDYQLSGVSAITLYFQRQRKKINE